MSRRILIVDDNEHFQQTARDLLEMRGFDVMHPVGDGIAARAAVDRIRPEGVLLDVNLPGEDGFSIAAALARASPTTRIVITSAEISRVPESALAECGAVAFVPKTELATIDLDEVFRL